MRLSTRGRYGTRAMLELALHYGEGPILLKDIARRQQVSERYLEQVVTPLKAAGLVTSARGARGGFSLARPPAEIRVAEIVEVLEGSVAPVECVDDPATCPRASACVTRDVWSEMKRAASGVLESITLEELARRQREREGPEEAMYHI